MKIRKDKSVKLDGKEIRINNFCFKREMTHIRIADIGGVFSHRVNLRLPVGAWLDSAYKNAFKGDEAAKKTLGVYASVLWSASSVVPDEEWCDATMIVTEDAMKRHPEWYGAKPKKDEEKEKEQDS